MVKRCAIESASVHIPDDRLAWRVVLVDKEEPGPSPAARRRLKAAGATEGARRGGAARGGAT